MKNIKLVMVIFIIIAMASLILLLDLFAIKGLLPFSQAVEYGSFAVLLGLLFLITGAMIWRHSDDTSSTTEGAGLILEPIFALTLLGMGISIIGSSILTLVPDKISELILGYYTPALILPATFLIFIVFIAYYRHIKNSPKT